MSTTEKFNEWYERLKSLVSGEDGAAPGERKGAELDSCVRQVKNQGHDEESAYAICNASLKAGLEKDERYELLDTAKSITDYPGEVPGAFEKLIDYAGLEVKSEEDLELPKVCRKCENRTRIKGNFMCPECHPDVDPKEDDYELVGSPVEDSGSDGEEAEKADEEETGPTETRKVYLDHGVSTAPDDATVRVDDKGLYYEEEVEADQKADPMVNGHDLDPETGEGICENTGMKIEAETMGDLSGDCPHCGEAFSVFDQKAALGVRMKAYGAEVFRVRAHPDDDTEYDGDVLGIGIDFPESDVYVDWRREAFPDELEDPHVSIYGSQEDLEQATGNVIEPLASPETPVDGDGDADQKADIPDNAVSISDRSEAPDDARVIQGDRGGLYYVPAGEDDGEDEDGDGDEEGDGEGGIEPGTEVDVGELEEGMEVSVFGKPMEVTAISHEEGPNNDQTAVAFDNLEDGEQQFFFADLLEGEIEANENTDLPARDDGEAGDGDRDLSELADDQGLLDADDLEAGDEVLIHGDEVTLDAVASDETGTVVQFEKNGEDFFLYEDMIDIEAPGFEGEEGGSTGSSDGDSGESGDGDTGGDEPRLEEGEQIESPSGEPATVTGYDPDTNVVAYETEDGEEMLTTAESVLGDEEDTGDDADAELADELGVQWANTEGLDDDQVDAVTSAFEEFREDQGLGDMAVMSVTTTPPDDVGAGAGASFTPNERRLYVNPDGLDPETKQEDFEEGFIATETVEGTIHHELAHARHFGEVLSDPDLNWQELQDQDLSDEEAETVSDEVSWYASTSPTELVAEVNSGIQEGKEYSDEVMDMYERFGGPEVNP